MSVIVKGMEMPQNCAECDLSKRRHSSMGDIIDCERIGTVGSAFRDTHNVLEHRHSDCPLIEIPTPHGNLKDESDIISLIEVMFCKDKDGMEHAIQCVKDAPTVIEGSET